jgi:hypothetical protein
MNIDIRLQVSFRDHPKRIKLERRLGAAGALALIDLLLSVAQSKPDGCLRGWTDEDIAIAAKWDGEPEDFVSTLAELHFLDRHDDGSYCIHDWTQHNGYAAGAPERSERARVAARARWDRQSMDARTPNSNANPCYPHCCPHSSALPNPAGSNAPTYVLTNIRTRTHTPGRTHAQEEVNNRVCVSSCDETTVQRSSEPSEKHPLELVPKPFQSAAERVLEQLAEFGHERIAANVLYSNHHAKTNYVAYLTKAIKENYAAGWEEAAKSAIERLEAAGACEQDESEQRAREDKEYAAAEVLYESLPLQEKDLLREETIRASPFLTSLGEKTIRRMMLFRLCESGKLLSAERYSRDGPNDCEHDDHEVVARTGIGGHHTG